MKPSMLCLPIAALCLSAVAGDLAKAEIGGQSLANATRANRAIGTLGQQLRGKGIEHRNSQAESWTSKLPRTRSIIKLLKQIQEDESVKKRFKAELRTHRRSNRSRERADAQASNSTASEGNTTSMGLAPATMRDCPFPEQPVLCKPLHERVLTISKPDIVQATLKATGHQHKCGVKQKPSGSLTKAGKQTRLIVFVALGGGLVCEKQSHDWRARFPQYMGKLLNATVVTWMIRFNSCFTCTAHGAESRSCVDLMHGGVDLLVILGSGRYSRELPCQEGDATEGEMKADPDQDSMIQRLQQASKEHDGQQQQKCPRRFTDLWHILQLPWARDASVKVHFPLRRMVDIVDNSLFGFDQVIDDSSFSKPPSTCTSAMLSVCPKIPKQRRLMYIARLHSGKGQLAFLDTVDPALLKNYTLHLYGGTSGSADETGQSYLKQVKSKAKEKKIRIRVHGEVGKGHLYAGMCTGVGLVHFAEDKNPRSVYEAVQAGLPVFINREAQVSQDLEAAPFVVATSATDPISFNTAFARFLSMLRQDWTQPMQEWAKSKMEESIIYTQLCEQMCMCEGQRTPASCRQVIDAVAAEQSRPVLRIMPHTDRAAARHETVEDAHAQPPADL